jgi:Na+-transporting NADH:ubiquinone oxidoreductase subunit A
MKRGKLFYLSFSLIVISINTLAAQSSGEGSQFLLNSLFVIAALVFFAIVIQVSDNLMAIEAKRIGADKDGNHFGLMPRFHELIGDKLPSYLKNERVIISKKGFDIALEGLASNEKLEIPILRFAVNPTNFKGISPIPKVVVEIGDTVKAGDPIFYDKSQPDLIFTAPVSGEIVEIKRGDKRAIHEIIILADKTQEFKSFEKLNIEKISREDLVKTLASSGLMTLFLQRPFNTLPNLDVVPRDIFVSTFDSAPLAPDLAYALKGQELAFQAGIDTLAKLTPGKVYLSLDGRGETDAASVFTGVTGAEKYYFRGKHPIGNVGVQIHHIKPISPTDKVWTINAQDVAILGNFMLEGKVIQSRMVAITGADLNKTGYVKVPIGASVSDLLQSENISSAYRIISGDVLSGTQVSKDGFVGFYDDQVTVVEEGNSYELFGWLLPLDMRPSVSKTFPSALLGGIPSAANTNTRGEKRAFVVTGEYDNLLPMDILPQQLFKAIVVNDIEKMENLGIHELVEEDVALCEFGCTSKQPLQAILRNGLDVIKAEG